MNLTTLRMLRAKVPCEGVTTQLVRVLRGRNLMLLDTRDCPLEELQCPHRQLTHSRTRFAEMLLEAVPDSDAPRMPGLNGLMILTGIHTMP